ncbi:MAG: Gfo/Idh/MocA family oxidoreductase [Colwellia sp.]|jgi:Predicted dehydrogenases and related proteins
MDIGVLIIGLGQIGMGYDLCLESETHVYSHCRAFNLHSSFSLLGGVDPDEKNRAGFENEYQFPAYKNLKLALKELEPDLVIISAPTTYHLDLLQAVLKFSDPKAILCEKPLSYDLEDARLMVDLCKEREIQLFVNYMRRSDPAVIEINDKLNSGKIATPVRGVAWYSKGLMHNGSHLFNLLEYWLGTMVKFEIISPGRSLENGDKEPDVKVYFEKGEIVFLSLEEENYSHYTIELMAPNGMLRYEMAGHQATWQPVIQNPVFKLNKSITVEQKIIETNMNKFQYNVASQVEMAFKKEKYFLSSGEDALRTIESLSAILGKV